MALTRKFLKAMGIEDEKVDEIIAAHAETVDALKEQSDGYKADADKLPAIQKQLDDAIKANESAGKDPYKVKYDALKEDFDKYKSEVTGKETHASKVSAYRALLKEAGISDKRIDAVLKVSDVDSVELEDGKIKDADKIKDTIKSDWADFIITPGEKGAHVDNPPAGNNKDVDYDKMTDAEYYAAIAAKKKE